MVSLARRGLRICQGQTKVREFNRTLNTTLIKPLMNWLKLPQATSHVHQIFCCLALSFLAYHGKGRSGQETDRKLEFPPKVSLSGPSQQQVDFFFLLFLPWSGTQRLHWERPGAWRKEYDLCVPLRSLPLQVTKTDQNHQIHGLECSELTIAAMSKRVCSHHKSPSMPCSWWAKSQAWRCP